MATQIERFIFQSLGANGDFAPMPSSELNTPAQMPVAAVEAPPPEPTMIMPEVEQAKREAYANGFRDAQKEAENKAQSELAKQNQAIAGLEATISSQLQEVVKGQAALFAGKQQELSQIAIAIAKKVAGNALKRDPLAAIEELVSQCLTALNGESKLTISVHPTVHLPLQKRLAPLLEASGFEGEATVLADDTLAKEDCKVEWKHGSASRDSARIWAEIESLVSSMKLAPAGKAEAESDEHNTIYLANR